MRIPVKRFTSRRPTGVGSGLTCLALLTLLLPVPGEAGSSYGHIRTVEGQANLLSGNAEPAIEATVNYPIQVGDRVLVSPGGRLEAVLPDSSLLRFDGNSELRFVRLAQFLDSDDDRNFLQLLQGQIQVSVTAEPIDPTAFRVDTANSSFFLLSRGSYRIFTDGKSWTQVIVREGFVEVATERGTTHVNSGQQALVDGDRSPKVVVQAAPPLDSLEQWAHRLDGEGDSLEAQVPYRRGILSPTLGYAAAPLHRHGRWMQYRNHHVWRPHVSLGWRPYHSGWWVYTPAGLTWISTEPWGWVPYHYGSWGLAGGIGWVWYPGHRYTPGAVHWYWGPTHVGWIPTRYYSDTWGNPLYAWPPFGHFGGNLGHRRHPGREPYADPSRFHGRAGGDVTDWRDWTFTRYEKFGYRDSHRFLETGAELRNRGVFQSQIPRGVMTTETRNLTPNLWHEPERVLATLERPPSPRSRNTNLSPLGEAALSGTSTRPWRSDTRQQTRSTRAETLVRQWDANQWRRDQLSRPRPVEPYRRDSRSSSSSLRGHSTSPLDRQQWRRQPTSGLSGRSSRSGSRFSRPAAPGSGRTSIGGARSPVTQRNSGLNRGRPSAGGRQSAGTSGRVSGSGRTGRSMKGGASRSTSKGPGSG